MDLRIRTPEIEDEMFRTMRLGFVRVKARRPYVYITLLISGSVTVTYAFDTMNTTLLGIGFACMLLGFCLLNQMIEIPVKNSGDSNV